MNKKLIPGIDFIGITTSFYCIDEDGKLLLHKRSDKCRDEVGRWDTGGGKLDFWETPQECVLREVQEEYGCRGKIIKQLSPISVVRDHEGKKTHWLSIPFIIRVKHAEVKNNEPEKMLDIGWFTLSTLPTPLHSGFENYILKTERRKHLEKYIS